MPHAWFGPTEQIPLDQALPGTEGNQILKLILSCKRKTHSRLIYFFVLGKKRRHEGGQSGPDRTFLSLQPSSPACIKNKHLHAWWCRVYDVVLLSLPGIVMVLRSKGAWSRKSFTAFPQRSQSLHSPPNAGSCGSLSLAPGGGSGGALGTPSALGKWEGQGVIVRHPGAKRKLWLSTVSIEQVPPWGGGRADLGLVRPQALFQPQAGSVGRTEKAAVKNNQHKQPDSNAS